MFYVCLNCFNYQFSLGLRFKNIITCKGSVFRNKLYYDVWPFLLFN